MATQQTISYFRQKKAQKIINNNRKFELHRYYLTEKGRQYDALFIYKTTRNRQKHIFTTTKYSIEEKLMHLYKPFKVTDCEVFALFLPDLLLL